MSSPETAPKVSHGVATGFPFVQGECPACGVRSLFVGSGGYITCSSLECTDPCSPSKALGITFPAEEPNHVR